MRTRIWDTVKRQLKPRLCRRLCWALTEQTNPNSNIRVCVCLFRINYRSASTSMAETQVISPGAAGEYPLWVLNRVLMLWLASIASTSKLFSIVLNFGADNVNPERICPLDEIYVCLFSWKVIVVPIWFLPDYDQCSGRLLLCAAIECTMAEAIARRKSSKDGEPLLECIYWPYLCVQASYCSVWNRESWRQDPSFSDVERNGCGVEKTGTHHIFCLLFSFFNSC